MILLIGASASGKTEVAKVLRSKYGIKKVVTHTTRTIRPSEIKDIDYHFVSLDEFQNMIKNDELVEYSFYNGNYYGSSKKEIGVNKVIILDTNGLKAYRKLNDKKIVTFSLLASEENRTKRMLFRGDEQEAIKKRIENDRITFSEDAIGETNFVIDTNSLTIEEVADVVFNEYNSYLKNL